jgi:hypothetical protein
LNDFKPFQSGRAHVACPVRWNNAQHGKEVAMWRQAWSALMVAALWMVPVGCNSSGGIGTGAGSGGAQPASVSPDGSGTVGPLPELVSMSRPPIADLPVPVGFDLAESKSRNFAAAGARYVDHVFTGRADKFAVGRFYKRLMPINRWALVTDMFVQGDIMLDFEKDTERCRVTITDGGFFGSIVVKIAVWTSGRIQAPSGAVRTSNYK